MPHDIATHWNSTFDMLEYALKHWTTVNTIMQRRDLKMRKFELSDKEWEVLE
jgi:hypothetical protein